MILDWLADLACGISVILGLLAVIAPPLIAYGKGRKPAARIANFLMSFCLGFALAYFAILKIMNVPDTGFGFILIIPAFLAAALSAVGWSVAVSAQRKNV